MKVEHVLHPRHILSVDFRDTPAAKSIRPSPPGFTTTQGQCLAFIHAYASVHRCSPAEADLQQDFGVTPPTVHQMVLKLERDGWIRRTPRTARSIVLLVDPKLLPVLI